MEYRLALGVLGEIASALLREFLPEREVVRVITPELFGKLID
jgi:hypothetical protein